MATPLSFGAELDDEQRETARKIVQRAIDLGLNDQQTRLAVAVAYQESRLRPNVVRGQDGEIGLMQVLPSTGKQFGFSVEDLRDPDKNIDAGLTVLKSQLDQYPKNPRLAIIGYNKGPDAKFFSGGELPQVTKDYLRDLTSYGAFEVPQDPEKPFVEKASEAAGELATKAMEDESLQAAAMGAGAGLVSGKIFPDEGFPRESTTGLERGVTRRRLMLEQLEKEFAGLPESARTAPPSVPEPSPIQLDVERAPPSQTGLERQIQGRIDPESGQTGRALETGHNETSAQRALRQRQQAAAEAALRRQGVISGPSPFSTFPIGSSPSGLLISPQLAAEAQTQAAQTQAEAQRASNLQNQINTARRNLAVSEGVLSEAQRSQPGWLAKAGAAFKSPMAKMIPGALTGLEVAEAGRRYEEGDYPGAALAGGAALGGGLMMAPTMPGAIGVGQKTAGALLQYGGGLGLLLYDIIRNKDRQEPPSVSATR
jgi:hypothetical protein